MTVKIVLSVLCTIIVNPIYSMHSFHIPINYKFSLIPFKLMTQDMKEALKHFFVVKIPRIRDRKHEL